MKLTLEQAKQMARGSWPNEWGADPADALVVLAERVRELESDNDLRVVIEKSKDYPKVEVDSEVLRQLMSVSDELEPIEYPSEDNEDLRDNFAGLAMSAMLNTELRKDLWASTEKIALDAYKMADAMLKARGE